MTSWPPDRSERGSVMLLFPAAVLIVMVLAAIAVDSSIAFLGQREVANATAAAANDAASQGVSNTAFYRYDDVELDVPTVEAVAASRVRAVLDPGRFRNLQVVVDVDPPRAPGCPPIVRVTAIARVDYVFARAVPGGPDDTQVAADSEASPRQPGQESC